jgi:hypothetical protein
MNGFRQIASILTATHYRGPVTSIVMAKIFAPVLDYSVFLAALGAGMLTAVILVFWTGAIRIRFDG